MTRTAVPVRVAAPERWQLVRSRHPEGWLWGVAGAGWLVLGVLAVRGGHHSAASMGGHAAGWPAMVAVMAPLISGNVRYAAMRSPRRSRPVVTVDVVAGWALVWAVAAVVLAVGTSLLVNAAGVLPAVALTTLGAIGWQHTRLKRRSLARCHRLLTPPIDRGRARRVTRRHGVALGRDCVLSCWPLMVLMAVAGHNPLVAASCVGVAWCERRRRPHHDPATQETSLVIAATGATAFVLAVLV